MERSSNKHSPFVDEQLAAEVQSLIHGAPVESRSQERRLHEDAGGEDDNTRLPVREDAGLSAVVERSDLARHLRPSVFPADRDTLVSVACDEGAPDHLVRRLRSVPENRSFPNVEAVWEAIPTRS